MICRQSTALVDLRDTASPVHIEQVPTLVGWWQGTCAERGLSWIVLSASVMCGIVENARTKSAPSSQDCAVILGEADGILRKSHQFLRVWKPEAESNLRGKT
ncbi:hypothetical protein N7449_003924 [Penicillium cf. viridicatum]|uniref:Uncharacterized protein n=1 Tax=Penicillium cf. viridicatum TaxID=2972119 RepID=A0A9W9MXU6_9EURO|nr:hypothetical protein N7449_003924 [Penicillium cf. viridicatum]